MTRGIARSNVIGNSYRDFTLAHQEGCCFLESVDDTGLAFGRLRAHNVLDRLKGRPASP